MHSPGASGLLLLSLAVAFATGQDVQLNCTPMFNLFRIPQSPNQAQVSGGDPG